MKTQQAAQQGRMDYEADLARRPLYHDGSPRPAWEQLSEIAKWSWNRPKDDRLAQAERLSENLARYWTVPVSVVCELGEWALVRRGDGLSFIVETKDLKIERGN